MARETINFTLALLKTSSHRTGLMLKYGTLAHVPALKLYTKDQKYSPTAVNYVIIQHTNSQQHVSHTWTK